jgi:hypothetical protein
MGDVADTVARLRDLEASLDKLLATPGARTEDVARWERTRETMRDAIAALTSVPTCDGTGEGR